MSQQPLQKPETSIEQEEAHLRTRLAEISELKRLAQKLGYVIEGRTSTIFSPTVALPFVPTQSFDGTIAGLIRRYRSDERSPYFQLKARVRNNYDGSLNRLVDDLGQMRVADLNADRINHVYNRWVEGGKIAMGHGLVGKLRLLATFGATILDDGDCIRFSGIMHTMRFKAPQARLEPMTAEHAKAVRFQAHEFGWHSIALAQAFQFDLKLRPIDVIGEWVPISAPIPSSIIWGNEKWVRGLRWTDVDDKSTLRFVTMDRFKRSKIEVDIKNLPMVKEELDLLWLNAPTGGPMIICETTGRPYSSAEFRRKWRLIASKAGVPDNVRNGDSIRAESGLQKGTEINTAGA